MRFFMYSWCGICACSTWSLSPSWDGVRVVHQEDNSAADEVEGDALEQVRESAARLQRVMRSYNEDADLLT